MSKNSKSPSEKEDLEWSEVAQLGLRYARIPLALLCVEAFYWFLTQPSDTLAPLQVTEAWLWNAMTNFLYSDGEYVASSLSMHNGWMTRIDFVHVDFPGNYDTVALYVSDECAGVHEMIFLSTLVVMTEGVPQKLKIRSIIVMCSIIYVLNIMRLVMFFPIAVNDCTANPNQAECLSGMWNFHTAVYEWGFLLVLVTMWVVWFWKVGGPARTLDASAVSDDKWRLKFRNVWAPKQYYLLAGAVLLLIFAAHNVTSNEEAMAAKETLDFCYFSELVTSECGQAQNRWNDAIGYAWSLSALGLLILGTTSVVIQRPDENGDWPEKPEPQKQVELSESTEHTPTSRHSKKKSGSWKKNSEEE
ncbi:MAG TPA: exosortase/archaeosortase family protein [Candidatus Poseidoniaceae archaeon]|nr:exosortase/archaeosortase family protein [Candidatus Poseidoniaceae archaeon]